MRCSTRQKRRGASEPGGGQDVQVRSRTQAPPAPQEPSSNEPSSRRQRGRGSTGHGCTEHVATNLAPVCTALNAGCQAPPGGGGLLWRAAAARKQPRPHRAWAWHKRGPSATPTASPTVPRASALSPPSASVWLEVAWPPQLHPQAESEQPVAVCSRGAPVPTPPPPTLAWPWFARPPQGPT